jgi:hypothetical protein
MRIGVISDTHGVVHPRVHEVFRGVDHILHAGDVGDEQVLIELEAIAPVTAVAGNVDGGWRGELRCEARATLGGLRFYLTHVVARPRAAISAVRVALQREPADVVVFGHSHLPHDEQVDGVWFFNPGSAGPRRLDYPVCVGLFEDTGGRWTARHVGLDARSEAALAGGLAR